MPALITVDAGKPSVELAASEEALEHLALALDRPVDDAGRIEFFAVSVNTLI